MSEQGWAAAGTVASARHFPSQGALLGALIAGILGWIAVPNGCLRTDTLQMHFVGAGVSIAAALPWCYRLARRATARPVSTFLRLGLQTYLLGFLLLAWTGVDTGWSALDEEFSEHSFLDFIAGGLLGFMPYIFIGALLWTAAILVLGSSSGRRAGLIRVAARARREDLIGLGASGLLVAVTLVPTYSFMRAPVWPVPEPLRPTIVGIIASATQDSTGYHTTLTDGRVVDGPQNGKYRLMGPIDMAGWLLLAGTTDGGFSTALTPRGNGCWEAWTDARADPIVWDMGDTILFPNGIELPKAPGFHVDPQPHEVDGRLAWTVEPNGRAMSFCANSQGQIESGELLI